MATQDLISRLRTAGVDLHLWRGEVRWSGPAKFPEKHELEFERAKEDIKSILTKAYDRLRFKDGPHEWILHRGVPGHLVCGSPDWCRESMRSVALFGGRDLRRWVHLAPENLSILRHSVHGWVAKFVSWPAGYGAQPEGKDAWAKILSICDDCIPSSKYSDDAKDDDDEEDRGNRG